MSAISDVLYISRAPSLNVKKKVRVIVPPPIFKAPVNLFTTISSQVKCSDIKDGLNQILYNSRVQ